MFPDWAHRGHALGTGVLVCMGRGSFTIRLLQARISQGFAFTLLCKSTRIQRMELYFF